MIRTLSLASLTLALGCKPPEAPENIEEMMVYGFENFDQEDPAYMVSLAENLIPWMDANMEEASDGYQVNSLTEESVAAAGVETVIEADGGIIGAVVGLDYAITFDALVDGLTHPHQEEIFTTYVEFERIAYDDRECFRDEECEFHSVHDDTHIDIGTLGIEMWTSFDASFRWVYLSDGTRALAHRNLGPEPVELTIDWMEVHQQYSFSFSYERPDGSSRRAQTIWVDGEIVGADMPDSVALNTGINSMKGSAEDMEAYMIEQGYGVGQEGGAD